MSLFEAQAIGAQEVVAIVSTDEVVELEDSLVTPLHYDVTRRLVTCVVDTAQVPLEEGREFCKMSVYHNSFTNWTVLSSTEFVDEVAKLVEVDITLVSSVVGDRHLDLTEHRRVVQTYVNQKISIARVKPVLNTENGEAGMVTQIFIDSLYLFQGAAAPTSEQVSYVERYKRKFQLLFVLVVLK